MGSNSIQCSIAVTVNDWCIREVVEKQELCMQCFLCPTVKLNSLLDIGDGA